ncbi:hypothetical protein U1Q18_024878 [Sarracenia purpurea var. burkii]
MAQDSNSLSGNLDSSLSLTVDIVGDHHESSSSATASSSSSSSLSVSDPTMSRSSSLSRLNAKAPEFVPSSLSPRIEVSQPRTVPSSPSPPPGLVHVYPGLHVPLHGGSVTMPTQNHQPFAHHVPIQYHHHHHQRPPYFGGGFSDHHEVALQAQQEAPIEPDHVPALKNGLSEEATQKLINQVEYYFSDLNLATTDHLMRFINKDAEGYVPISVVASFKKIKAAISSNSQLACILRNSAKLVVSEDGKKVKRQHPLTELDMEELQSRIVIAENLPEDHCHQNLMKIFSAVGSVKTIRTCQPQTSNGGASPASRLGKGDSLLFSNKLHAFVEYESVELAEKAVAELNDEANWRSGLRVRLLLRRTAKSAQVRGKKFGHETDANCEEEETSSTSEQPQLNDKQLEDPSQPSDAQSHEYAGDEHVNDREGGQKKGRSRGRGKGRGRAQFQYNHRGSHVGTPPPSNSVNIEQAPSTPKQPPGPRMPDGTKGFSWGRGKPVAANTA